MNDSFKNSGTYKVIQEYEREQQRLFKKYQAFYEAAEIELPKEMFKRVIQRMEFDHVMKQPPQK